MKILDVLKKTDTSEKRDTITLKGRSAFEFDKDGKISRLTDVV